MFLIAIAYSTNVGLPQQLLIMLYVTTLLACKKVTFLDTRLQAVLQLRRVTQLPRSPLLTSLKKELVKT